MNERRCGTCRHWKDSVCLVFDLNDGPDQHAEMHENSEPCPAWTDGTEYARGFEAAKVAAIECCNEAVSWSGHGSVFALTDLIVAKIDRLTPEVTQ